MTVVPVDISRRFDGALARLREPQQSLRLADVKVYESAELDAPAETWGTECPGPVAMT
jgi:hypothetical protein